MTREGKKLLFDIATAIDHIFSIHLDGIVDQDEFASNLTVQRAVERELVY